MSDRFSEIVSSLFSRSGGWKQFPKFKEEIESWRPFWEALRKEDQEVFERMLVSVWDYAEAMEASPDEELSATETFLLSIMLAQEKMIEKYLPKKKQSEG